MSADTVIVGAGPTGLTAACALLQQGVGVTLLDAKATVDPRPKAIVLWSGALEALQRIGLGDAIRQLGRPLARAEYLSGNRRIMQMALDQVPDTDFSSPISLSQPMVERLLTERLRDLGGEVLRGRRVEEVCQGEHGVRVSTGQHSYEGAYLIGADGVASAIRSSVGITMDGRTFEREFLLADGVVEGAAPDMATYSLSPHGVIVIVPLAEGGHRVFLDLDPRDVPGEDVDLAEVIRHSLARRASGHTLVDARWTSRFRLQTRIASSFSSGRVFLAGDAAHAHSPAGGQGLNTGVQDGFDLAWRFAAIAHGAHPDLLAGYEAERRPVALRALRQADQQTTMWLLDGAARRRLRDGALKVAGRLPKVRGTVLSRLAQLELGLQSSPGLVHDGAVKGQKPVGSRASASERGTGTRHRLLVDSPKAAVALGARPLTEVSVRTLPSTETRSKAASSEGAGQPQLIWIRPDGVIGGRVRQERSEDILRLLPSA